MKKTLKHIIAIAGIVSILITQVFIHTLHHHEAIDHHHDIEKNIVTISIDNHDSDSCYLCDLDLFNPIFFHKGTFLNFISLDYSSSFKDREFHLITVPLYFLNNKAPPFVI